MTTERCAGSGQLTLYGGDRRQSLCPVCHQTVATLPRPTRCGLCLTCWPLPRSGGTHCNNDACPCHPDGWPVLAEHRAREWQALTISLELMP